MPNPFTQELENRRGGNPFARELEKRRAGGSPSTTFANRGIATVAGAPVDLANELLGLVGLRSERPIGGSESIEQSFRWIEENVGGQFVPKEGEKADDPLDYIFRSVGETAAGLGPLAKGAQVAAQSAKPTVRAIGQQFTQAPVSGAALDVTAGVGAGAGRYAGEQQGSEYGGIIGELLGGVGVAGLPSAVRSASKAAISAAGKAPVLGGALRIAGEVAPFTRAGGINRANRRMRGLVPDAEDAAKALDEQPISGLTPAQRTGDERLLALEREVAAIDPAMTQRLRERAQRNTDILTEELRNLGGDAAAVRPFVEKRYNRVLNALDERVKQAGKLAQQRLREAGPQLPRGQAALIVREEIENALSSARAQERRLWGAVPDDVMVDTSTSFQAFKELVEQTPRTQRQKIPGYVKQFLDMRSNQRLGDVEPVAELQGLRSELLGISRRARSDGDFNVARISDSLADAVLRNMEEAEGVGPELAAARDFSRRLNEKFKQGEIGKILGFAREGGEKVPAELTLDTTVGRGGERGAVSEASILKAVEDAPDEARKGIAEYIRQRFVDAAVDEGRVSPSKARSFVRANDRLLDRYPDLKRAMLDAEEAQKIAERVGRSSARMGRNLRMPSRSRTARFLGGDVDNEVAQIFNARDPKAVAREMRRQVSKDETGEAAEGLRGAVIDHMIERARDTTPEGRFLSGAKIEEFRTNERFGAALRELFTPEQIQRMDKISSELLKMERARGRLPNVGGVMDDAPNQILTLAGRIIGARTGAQMGGGTAGGSLQAANIMSGRVKRWLENLTNDRAAQLISDAVEDPELFRTILMPLDNLKSRKTVQRNLDAWLAGTAAREMKSDDDGTEQE